MLASDVEYSLVNDVQTIESWEKAYLRFETPEQEIRKFIRRLRELRYEKWPRESRILELFCGRGNGLVALGRLGFTNVEGVDLSERLIAQYTGSAKCYVADCTRLPFESQSRDIAIVQGGLHHLNKLPDDLESTLLEMRRVIRPGGRIVVVEPWLTPFLALVHVLCTSRVLRRFWRKLDALATMIEFERETYESWLSLPELVLEALDRHFVVETRRIRMGKLMYIGRVG
jgi:ubiquinone/menaquinone biosynthesis C-methylase UbiE